MILCLIQIMLSFVNLSETEKELPIQSEILALKDLIKEYEFCENLKKVNKRKELVHFATVLKEICNKVKIFAMTMSDLETYESIDVVIQRLEVLLKESVVADPTVLDHFDLERFQQINDCNENEQYKSIRQIALLTNELILIFREYIKENIETGSFYEISGKFFEDERYYYLEIDILFDEVINQLEFITNDALLLVKYLKERKNLDKFNINYINIKKSFLKIVIYFILLCEKRNDFRYIISSYAEIYKKTIERVINHFINKYKEINESTKRILKNTHLLHLKIQFNKKNTDFNVILNNLVKMHCYFQMARDLYYIMIKIFENKAHKYTEEKSELKAYHREMLSNKILNEEFFDYFEFINASDLLKWVKNSVMRYKEQAELKKEEHKKHKNNRKLEITKLLNEIQTTILKIRHSQSVLDKPTPLLDEHFFENLKKTFDSYCSYFLNIIDFWYSLDIYFIKKDILMSFCKYLIDNDLVLDISDKNELINMLEECYNKIFDNFNYTIGVYRYLFTYIPDSKAIINDEFHKVLVSLFQKCIEIQHEIFIIFRLFPNVV